ncbi:hypothetical protein [Actinokineospora fastidiosa]|uniref:Uncharacterized protein n=1 Tax=Actinokineospora fastidiosa TaxID=1816 RepID=A0A918G2E2_9PSEU|nr:hypothetical protein [Actinokineospora fastidiosa]GGS15965.1 hypothetical protein GCM10010171_05120 [Actinokineospora fastidiosa]
MRGVVNLLMVLLGASGCSNAVVGHPSPEPLRATEVILLSPMSAPEDTARWRITEEAVGGCHSSSISPANSRARRCFTEDSQVLDPCYVSPFAGSDEALCLSDPTGGDAVRIVITSDA